MTTCAWLENMMSIETDGWTRPCCLETNDAARISKISDGIRVAFNHPKLMQLREDLKDGFSEKTHYACNRCASLESRGQDSMRTTTRGAGGNTRELKVLQFKMSNKCQLTCAHCGPERSSGWRKLLDITPHVINSFEVTDEFITELKEILPGLSVLKFSGGEPFLDPRHWKILDALKDQNRSHCRLEYITNGLVTPRYDLWKGWGDVSCSVSADGFEETFNWFRRGADWNELVTSVDKLKDYSNVSINYAITPYTFESWPAANKFWKYNINPYLIVTPKTSSFFQFPKRYIDEDIPFRSAAADIGNIYFYKNWAKSWDTKWNTIGWSERIFKWMQI